MNDRFKFRVWDKKNSEYVPEGKMCDVHCLLHRDGTLDCGIAYDDGYAGGIDWVKTEDAVIEQCTGLKDKNGKLIYEGDIISRGNGYQKEILFYQGGFGWWSECGWFVSFSGHNHLKRILQNHEIIGNVHDTEVGE